MGLNLKGSGIMKSVGKKLIIVSFILALLASVVIFVWFKSLEENKEAVVNKIVLIAAEDIPANTLIDKKMVKEVEVIESDITNNYISNSDEIVGKYTKETIFQGEGFVKGRLVNEESSDLSLKIDSNHRAVAINATADAGVADLLKPGHYVDIIVYLPEKKKGQEVIRPDMAKIILQNVKIIAIDKELNRELEEKDKQEEGETMPTTFLVTLSIPVESVEKLVLAEDIGSLKLVLRPLDKEENINTEGATWEKLTFNETIKKNEKINDKQYVNYTVKSGDTLRKISKAFYGDPDKYFVILENNDIHDKNIIRKGMVLKIPALK